MKNSKVLLVMRVSLWMLLCCFFTCGTIAAAEEEEEEEEFEDYKSEHQQMQERSYLDFTTNAADLEGSPEDAAKQVVQQMNVNLENRIAQIFEKAKTPECRAKIAEHYSYFVNAIALEHSTPFGEVYFENSCPEEVYDLDNLPEGMHIGMVQNRTYQPEDGEYIDHPFNLKLLYGILTHRNANETIRLIQTLYEPGHLFVLHVDGKESSDETYQILLKYAQDKDYMHMIPHPYRCRVNWGGFSMVNATMQILQYSFGLLPLTGQSEALDFHKFVHLSSTSYPIASNTKIRNTLASYPLDANLLNVIMKPTRPAPQVWFYFVECDDWVHRIYRQRPLNELNGGIELYTSSQWFVLSREFALYMAEAEPGTLVADLLEYMEHVVVADESFFGTLIRNSEFCTKHHNWNFVHLQFDRWENDLEEAQRDERKCIMREKNHCGRSPTTMTGDYAEILELSGDLFARKFLDNVDTEIKDYLDVMRQRQEVELAADKDDDEPKRKPSTEFEGHGVMIVAKDTVNDTMPLCLGLGPSRNKARLVPCFQDHVPLTLIEGWETGAVIEQEVLAHNRWNIGPCSSDGDLQRSLTTAELNMTAGTFSKTGPRCMLTQVDGIRTGRCLDGDSGVQPTPGGAVQVFPCAKRWHQFFSFGGNVATDDAGEPLPPKNSIHTSIPRHMVRRLRDHVGFPDQDYYICLGVKGRGDKDEEDWVVDQYLGDDGEDLIPEDLENLGVDNLPPFRKWSGMQLVSTQCSNTDAVIEWLYVPFIVEEEEAVTAEKSTEEIEEDDESRETPTPATDDDTNEKPEESGSSPRGEL